MTRIPEHLRDRADRMLEAGINTEEIAPSLAEESEEPFSADRKNRWPSTQWTASIQVSRPVFFRQYPTAVSIYYSNHNSI